MSSTPTGETQLAVTVRACVEAATVAGSPTPRRPWVEPLPDVVSLAEVVRRDPAGERARAADPGRSVVLGLGDAPQDQSQLAASVDLEASGGLIVFGMGGSGKTTALRTIAAGLVQQGPPEAVRLFALDFTGRSLSQLAALPHTVGVATGDDLERVTRMLTMLRQELEHRRRVLARAHAETVSALRRQAGTSALPRLVLLLDSYAGFHATFEQGPLYGWLTDFQRLVTEGRQVGIHVVMTTTRQLGVPTALTSAMGARVVLRMASAEELIGLGVPRDTAKGAELGEGRGFLDDGIEVQLATVSEDPAGAAQAEAVEALAGRLAHSGVAPAPGLLELPELVRLPAVRPAPLRCPLGLADLSLDVVEVDLSRQSLVVLGPPGSGRSAALVRVAKSLAASATGPRLVGVGGLTSPLAALDLWHAAGFGRAKQPGALDEAAAVVEGYEGDEVKVVVVMDSVEDLDSMENNPRLDGLLRSDAVRVAAVVEPATLGRAYSGWMAELKRNRAVLVLQPGGPDDVEAVAGVKPSLRPGQTFPPGRGVLVDHGRPLLVQVASEHAGTEPVATGGRKRKRKAGAPRSDGRR